MATNWYLFLICRFVGGLGVGASSVTAPIYISEVSPAKFRGRMVALFQFNVVLGILVSYLSNYLIGMSGSNFLAPDAGDPGSSCRLISSSCCVGCLKAPGGSS